MPALYCYTFQDSKGNAQQIYAPNEKEARKAYEEEFGEAPYELVTREPW